MIYKSRKRSIRNVPIKTFLEVLEGQSLCVGLERKELITTEVRQHRLIKKIISDVIDTDHCYYRSPDCDLLVNSLSSCQKCIEFESAQMKIIEKNRKKCSTPVPLNAPISATSSTRLLSTIQNYREDNRALLREVESLRKNIERNSVKVDDSLHGDLQSIFNSCDERKLTPFLKLFWTEQMKYLQTNPSQVS